MLYSRVLCAGQRVNPVAFLWIWGWAEGFSGKQSMENSMRLAYTRVNHFIGERGRIWFKEEKEEEKEVGPGTCLYILAGVHFQYRNTASDPLTFLCVTMPPFQSNEQTTMPVEPHWKED
jgi:mannose-6-phosphate isomerase-like protein (cupin superfamily)